jgi:serine/threonine-protein kinase
VGQETDPQGKIAMGPDGSLYIADTENNVIRRVVPGSDGVIGDGNPNEEIITTVIGYNPGTAGYFGDDGPANTALLNGPRDIKAAPDGSVIIADTENNCIRKVSPGADSVVTGDADEIITTVAGRCGDAGNFAGDGAPAALAALNRPYGIELDAAGNLYIADTYNNRVRIVYK